jgi:hypothetical protein
MFQLIDKFESKLSPAYQSSLTEYYKGVVDLAININVYSIYYNSKFLQRSIGSFSFSHKPKIYMIYMITKTSFNLF